MKGRRLLWIGLLVTIVLVLAACGGDDEDSEASDIPALSETITTEADGSVESLTLHYPANFVVEDEFGGGSLWIANSQDALDMATLADGVFAGFQEGQFALTASALAKDDMLDDLSLDDEDPDPATTLTVALNEQGLEGLVGSIEATRFGDHTGAMTVGPYTIQDTSVDVMLVLVETNDAYVLITGFAPEGEIGQYDSVIRAIAASAQVAPLE